MSAPSDAVFSGRPTIPVVGPALLCSGLTLALLFVLRLVGVVEAMDRKLAGVFAGRLGETPVQQLPVAVTWGAAAVVALLLPLALFSCPHAWQRCLLWLSSVVVLAAWAPVLALAAHHPGVSPPVLAALLTGLLVLIQLAWLHRGRRDLISPDHEAS